MSYFYKLARQECCQNTVKPLAAILNETREGLMRYLQLDCAILPEISKQERTQCFLSESIALLSNQT